PAGLDKADAPVLVISGKHEYAQMRASALDILAALPNAQASTVDFGKGAGLSREHNWALNAPDLFTRTLQDWIEGRPVPADITP
ncbi:MAG: hypothetical protein AAGU05_07535, partial [Anaerolineaceae bacterium]